jgi:PhzF family phenazine biosynthesis protein
MKYYIVDAFADQLFKGNPAGVCLLDYELSDEIMQKIAYENNLAETALQKNNQYILRWFTPEVEIDLCGHATLATAFVVMNYVSPSLKEIEFETQSGKLTVVREGDIYTLDFPNRMPKPIDQPELLEKALGCKILETHLSRDLVVLVENEDTVLNLILDMDVIRKISQDIAFAIIVTAKGDSCVFVSRFFAPNAGIMEDPVTGSAHSTLIPFWSERLGKTKMIAKQLSHRGGTLYCEYCNDRVKIGGTAVCYLQGELLIEDVVK